MNLNSTVVVDFEAFRGVKNQYLIKEFVAVDLTTGCFIIVLFAPPYERARLHLKIRKINHWLETQHHRIRWNDGNVPYKDMVRIVADICSNCSTIFTKGFEKTNFLRQLYHHGEFTDMNDIGAPVVPTSFVPVAQCPVPHRQPVSTPSIYCALRKALFYAEWLRERYRT